MAEEISINLFILFRLEQGFILGWGWEVMLWCEKHAASLHK